MQISRSERGESLPEPSVRSLDPQVPPEPRDVAERERASSRDTVRIRPVWISRRSS